MSIVNSKNTNRKLMFKLTLKMNIYKLDLPVIFNHLIKDINIAKKLPINIDNLNHEQIINELTRIINKYYYSNNDKPFTKSFGFRTINYTDIYFNPINNIDDNKILVDEHRYAFSFDDLNNVKIDTIHPYMGDKLILDTMMFNSKHKLYDYYRQIKNMTKLNTLPLVANNMLDKLSNLMNNYYFTYNLVEIYQNRINELDYTVELIKYIISRVQICEQFCVNLFDTSYQCASNLDKYGIFIDNLIRYIEYVNENYNNIPNVIMYIGILFQRILEYRYNVLVLSKELYDCIKTHFDIQLHNKLHKSIQLDCSNYLYSNNCSECGFMNINIDTIFSNCNPSNYYRIMLYYLHNTYMYQLNRTDFQINDYTKPELFSYLNILRYFISLYDYVLDYDILDTYLKMIQRYYLMNTSIVIIGDYIYD